MGHMPALISDLALILLVAGLMTILCKKLNQPSILGYILAGVLIGPVVDFFPTVADTDNIRVWSDIGVIFLMFALGLEFSVHKLSEVGSTGFISAIFQVVGVGLSGFVCGQLLGYDFMNSLFLGGMLSMSSTMITLKALDDLGYKDQPFVGMATGTLVIEDIAAIFLMVILSTLAISQTVSGITLLGDMAMLFFYLILWLLLGIYILPTFLKKTSALMNNEMLLVFSLGVCFSMAWLANSLGFSTALGAFLAGSILAGTVHAEHIEHLVKPCKDLFGAVFFVSVGLLVNPAMILEYLIPIIIITLVTIISKLIFLIIGMLFSGQSIHDSVYAASAQTQIGEFSFIIAALGVSLGVTADFLYPVIVAVSVVTTFTTPFFVRYADTIIKLIEKLLPDIWKKKITEYQQENETTPIRDNDWAKFFKNYLTSLITCTITVLGLILIAHNVVTPWLYETNLLDDTIASYVVGALVYFISLPFIYAIIVFRKRYFTSLWLKSKANRIPLLLTVVLRYCIAWGLLLLPAIIFWNLPPLILVLSIIPSFYVLHNSDRLGGHYLRIEAKFLSNFNERKLQAYSKTTSTQHNWLDEQLYVVAFRLEENSNVCNQTLLKLNWNENWHIKVIRIKRGKKIINIPSGNVSLLPNDILYISGQEKQLDNFMLAAEQHNLLTCLSTPVTLREFISHQDDLATEDQLLCYALKITKETGLNGKNIKESPIKSRWNGFLIGIERDLYPIIDPAPNMILFNDDLLWMLGTQTMGSALAQEKLI